MVPRLGVHDHRILELERAGRLRRPDNPDGVTPGEAAACLIVDRYAEGALASLKAPGFGHEAATLWNEEPHRGDGLVEAARGPSPPRAASSPRSTRGSATPPARASTFASRRCWSPACCGEAKHGTGLRYQAYEPGNDPPLLHDPTDPELAKLAEPFHHFRAGRSLRDVEPGAMVDLPDHSIIVGGLDMWTDFGREPIPERRLAERWR